MISISHQQAQFLLRRAADRRLPEEQWSALQAHLEGCPTCRAYQARLDGLQRGLRRALRARWRYIEPPASTRPPSAAAQALAAARLARQKRSKRLVTAALALLAVILLAVVRFPGGPAAAPAPTPTAAPVLPTATATPLPGERFQGLVAFESRRSGNSDIYLLQVAGGERELTNLTQHPAEDVYPAWSPDGEWLAFLSDRAPGGQGEEPAEGEPAAGKRELYVISVAGSSLTQLTDEPDIDWEGPLDWSPDGKWISLSGRRRQQNGDPWIYLVPLDGSGPISVPGSRGAAHPAGTFSSLGPVLAARDGNGRIFTYNPQSDWRSEGLSADALQPGAVIDEFSWVAQGNNLLYLMRRRERSFVAWTSGQAGFQSDRVRSLAPHPNSPVVAVLQDAGDAGCWTLHLFISLGDSPPVREAPQLCVLGDLVRASWAPVHLWTSGAWVGLVVAGQPSDQAEPPGIYALRVPYVLSAAQPWPMERLADLAPGEAPAMHVRPNLPSLGITPVGVAGRTALGLRRPEQAVPPVGLPGRLLVVEVEPGGRRSALVEMRPDGSERRVLLSEQAVYKCPVWSPDRERIAFLSDRSTRSGERGPDELYVLEVATRAVTRYSRVSYSGQPTEDMPHRFSCPVWSPDGEYLATVTQEGRTSAVLVYDNRGRLLRFAPVSRQTLFADLVWSPDTDTIYVPQPAARVSAPRIARVPWRQPVAASSLLSLEGWSDIHALAISPDGAYMAFIYLRYGSDEEQKTAVDAGLRIVRLSDMFIMVDKKLYNYDPYKVIGRGRIVWLPGRQVVFAVPQGPGGPNRALLLRYDPAEDTVQTLAMIEDTLYDWALNGSWLVYSTESGVWGAPVDGILDPLTAPYRLSETPVLSLHWR